MSASQFNDSLIRPMFSFTEELLKATEVYLDDVKFVEENLEFTDEEKLYMSFHLSSEDAELYKRLICNFKVRRYHRTMEANYVEEEWPNMAPEYDLDAVEKAMENAMEKAMEAELLCKEGDTVYIDHLIHMPGFWPIDGLAYIYTIHYLQKEGNVMVYKTWCGFKQNAPQHFTFLSYSRPFTFTGKVLP